MSSGTDDESAAMINTRADVMADGLAEQGSEGSEREEVVARAVQYSSVAWEPFCRGCRTWAVIDRPIMHRW